MAAAAEEFQFQAETKQLLDLMIHSLYTNKEIFLRELISNSSDALDRLRFEALTKPELIAGNENFEIRLDPDHQNRTLTISDTGIGMSRDEVISNIGTIAKSGTRELRERMKEASTEQAVNEFIGQFGVGFYSAFMVADRVTLETLRAGETVSTRWESTGDGTYKIGVGARTERGTSITLHLNPVDVDSGIEDYTEFWTISRIVKKHSDFVGYPVICKYEHEEVERDEEGKVITPEKKKTVVEDRTLNSMRPIWTRPQSEVDEKQYAEFYRHISHDWNEPFKTLSLKAEGTFEYQALLFIPSKAPNDLFFQGVETGLRLYARKVMIVESCEELLPRYLRFIKGVVDSADLPLNISRQMLQQDRHIAQIRKWLTKKVLDFLDDLAANDKDKYLEFWQQFGRVMKEGVAIDFDNKDRVERLLLFQSSNDGGQLTTFADYVSRMKEGQKEIYYLTGESRSVVENSPHLEAFKAKGYEVLYLVEPVDELLVQSMFEFDGKQLRSVGKGEVNLGTDEEKTESEKELKEKQDEGTGLLEFMAKTLDQQVKQVRLSNRLVSSPACLVGGEADYSPQMERLLQRAGGSVTHQKRILEVNPDHEIYKRMLQRFNTNQSDESLAGFAELLLGYAFLAEGSELPDPVKFNQAMTEMMLKSL